MTRWKTGTDAPVEAGPLEEFIEFHQAGAPAVGHFACVTCGSTITLVGLLPDCRECGGSLWESPDTSPFAGRPTTEAAPEEQAWHERDVERLARLVHGVWYTLAIAAAFWVVLAAAFAYLLTPR